MSPDPETSSLEEANFPQEEQDGLLAGKIIELLKGVSMTRAQNILKMVGGRFNQRVISSFAPIGPSGRPPGSQDTRGQKGPRKQPKAPDEVRAVRSKIQQLNTAISKKSRVIGAQLERDDPLLQQRNQLFRDLKEAQDNPPGSFKEGKPSSSQAPPIFGAGI
jgi:hypothetical protein